MAMRVNSRGRTMTWCCLFNTANGNRWQRVKIDRAGYVYVDGRPAGDWLARKHDMRRALIQLRSHVAGMLWTEFFTLPR